MFTSTDRRRQVLTAAIATSILLYIMYAAPGAGEDGLTPELIFAGLPLAVGLAWLYPVEIALLFVVATMFRIHEAYPFLGPYRIPLVTAALAMIAVALHTAARNMSVPWRPEIKLMLLLSAHATLGMVFSVNFDVSIELWPDMIGKQIAGMMCLAMILKLPRDAVRVGVVLVAASTLISWVAIYNQINAIEVVEGSRIAIGRSINSLLGDPNDLCFVLMFPTAFALSALLTPGMRPGLRAAAGVALVFVLWAIIATKSRGGVLATIMVLGYQLNALRQARLTSMALAAGVGMALYLVAGIGRRDYGMTSADAIDSSSMSRVAAWKAAVQMALVHPVFGVGLGGFVSLYFFYTEYWIGRAYATHSMWFQILAEQGFIGLGLFVAMIVVSVRSSMISTRILLHRPECPPEMKALAASIAGAWIGVCVAGTFLTQAFSWQIYTLVALTAVLNRYVTESYAAELAAARKGQQEDPEPASHGPLIAHRTRIATT